MDTLASVFVFFPYALWCDVCLHDHLSGCLEDSLPRVTLLRDPFPYHKLPSVYARYVCGCAQPCVCTGSYVCLDCSVCASVCLCCGCMRAAAATVPTQAKRASLWVYLCVCVRVCLDLC